MSVQNLSNENCFVEIGDEPYGLIGIENIMNNS